METKTILRIVVASPSDVQDERRMLDGIIDELNRGMAAAMNVRLELCRWETDAFPGFHPEGPQGLIDPILKIADCEIFLGIFWRRFGTPAKGAASGTEHEFQTAYQSWKIRGRPQIMFYFREDRQPPQTAEEQEQRALLDVFKKNFPKEGFSWNYKNKKEFERLVRNNLSNYLRQHAQALSKPAVKNKNDRAILQSYSRQIQQRFSTIHLLGEKRHDTGDALSRMADMSAGFIPLHLIDWQDDSEGRSTAALNIEEIFFDNPPVGEFVEPQERHFLLRGLPGSGKTTLLRHLAHRFAALGLEDGEEFIPVYLRLKDLKLGKTSLEAFVREQIDSDSGSGENTETLCGHGRFLDNPMVLLFDGLDEIEDAETNKNIAEALNELARQHPRCKIIVSSRPVGLQKEDYPKYRPLDLLPLSPEMIHGYLDKWFSTDAAKTAAIQETLKSKPRIRALASNPFLLSMICFTYEHGGDASLIERRSELYKNCTNRLLKRRYALDATMADDEKILTVLKDLSLRFFLWQEADFPVDHVNVIGRRVLTAEELGKTEDFLDAVQRDTGLIQRDRQGFTFVHRSLWEYFTALALLDKKLDFVIRHAANPDWEEVVRLYAGLLKKNEDVQTLVDGLWTINRPLALRVTTEVKTPASELLQPLIARETGNQGKLLLIDSLAQSLPLIAETDRQNLVEETLRILLIDCNERDCEVIYHAQKLLEKMTLRPLEPDGLIYELFDLKHAAARQKEFLKDPATHFEWVDVKGGVFWMGDDEHFDDEKPAHRVKVDGFQMAKHPVTNRLLSHFPFGQKFPNYGGESHPAIGNTLWEAYYFALWIDARLPTEAEWEYAARGGRHAQRTQYYFGDDANELPNHAWLGEDNRQFAHAVDERNPRTGKENLNPLGLANMLGNVWEWCEDWYGNYRKPKDKDYVVENQHGPKTGQYKIRRGGGFTNSSDALRCARRNDVNPDYRFIDYGFRVVCGASRF